MMRKFLLPAALLLPLLAGGCIKTAMGVVTAPFKAAGQAADWATTSQDESDRNYGRKMRKQESQEGRERKKSSEECRKRDGECAEYEGYRAGDVERD